MKKISLIISFLLTSVLVLFLFTNNNVNKNEKENYIVKDIEIKEKLNNNIYDKFDSYEIEYKNKEVSFVGYSKINPSDLFEYDLVSDTNSNESIVIKYISNYDYINGIVSLSVVEESNEDTILDTIYGVIITNENNEFDVIFVIDDDYILLSEINDINIVDTVGFFSKVKKVWKTTSGKVGTIATVAACATVGAVCAVVPGGQLVTAVCIGAAVGLVGGAVTAGVSTYLNEGEVDWAAVGCYAGLGAVVGGATAGAAYGITTAITTAANGATTVDGCKSLKYGDSYEKIGTYNKNPNITVDWANTTKHASERMIERGMNQTSINNIVKNGECFLQSNNKYFFITNDGVAVVDSTGKLITAYSSDYFDETIWILLKLLGMM